jgi:hypothetical protein
MESGMKFRMSQQGAQSANQGIRGIFSALAQAPMLRDQAEMESALRTAQTYNANQSGNLHGAKAEQEQYTLGRRKAMPTDIAADSPAMDIAKFVFGNTGDTNAENVSKALLNAQTYGIRNQAVDNVDSVESMNKLNVLAKPGETYMPFDAVGTTGRAMNKATGLGKIVEEALASGYDRKINSEVGENNAQAYSASQSGNLSKARIGHLGTNGGSAAALQRARANVVNDVFEDVMIDPMDREAEVERRMALISLPSKSAEPSASGSTMGAVPDGIPPGSKQIGTSGGKAVYQAPNGKKYIVE